MLKIRILNNNKRRYNTELFEEIIQILYNLANVED